MSEYLNDDYYMKRVKIKDSDKVVYIKDKIVGKCGTVIRISGSHIGVLVNGMTNSASSYGVYWFNKDEVKIIKDDSEDIKMEGYKNIAIVNLLEDCNKKDYAFALYDEEFAMMKNEKGGLVVVNARGKDNRILGIVKEIISIEDFYSINKNKWTKITAEVVGIVNIDGYIAREEEKVRLEELEKKKAAIERELEAEINKRKSIEYYEAMAKEYSDNPKLAELVAELKNLGA